MSSSHTSATGSQRRSRRRRRRSCSASIPTQRGYGRSARCWRPAGAPGSGPRRPSSAHCRAAIDATADACVAVKPQLACFERLGRSGRTALGEVVDHAHDAGLLVLADAKRGDIDVSAAAYAQALVGTTPTPFGDVEGLWRANAFTANPYQGVDSLQSFVDHARPEARGASVLVRTSNPGAADLQDLRLDGGEMVADRPAGRWSRGCRTWARVRTRRRLRGYRRHGPGASCTAPRADAVDAVPASWRSAPKEDASRTWPPPSRRVARACPVTSSRGIVNAYEASRAAPAVAARREAERLRELRMGAWRLNPMILAARALADVGRGSGAPYPRRAAMIYRSARRWLAPAALAVAAAALLQR